MKMDFYYLERVARGECGSILGGWKFQHADFGVGLSPLHIPIFSVIDD